MALSPQALIRGIVSRILPAANPDVPQVDVPPRFGRYGEIYDIPLIRKQHGLADEGSYFLFNNNSQTGIIANGASAFSATAPSMTIFNSDVPTNPNYKRVYLDFLKLVTTVVGSAASGLVNLQAAIYIDTGNRLSSAGTALVGVSPNMDSGAKPVSVVTFGAIVATTASLSARVVDPLEIVRAAVSGTVLDVVGEQKTIIFGAVEGVMNGSITVANANNIPVPAPPVIIGPQQTALVYLWQNNGATNVAATYAPNLGLWER